MTTKVESTADSYNPLRGNIDLKEDFNTVDPVLLIEMIFENQGSSSCQIINCFMNVFHGIELVDLVVGHYMLRDVIVPLEDVSDHRRTFLNIQKPSTKSAHIFL